jgi:quinol monooxygenase YgiN
VVALVKSKVKDPARPFAMLVTIKAKEPGCLAYELNRDPDEPTSYLMFEQFKNIAALKAEHTTRLLKALEALTDGQIKAKVYVVPE